MITFFVIIAINHETKTLSPKIVPWTLFKDFLKDFHTEIYTSCSICLEEFKLEESIRVTNCNHIFHHKCIEEWICKSPTCPLCRKNLKTTDIKM